MDAEVIRYVIAVCTAHRPEMLRACLTSIAALDVPTGGELAVVIVENDTEPRSAEIVSEISANSAIAMHHRLEPRRGIPIARNTALEQAIAAGADWIGLVDDDETVDPDWLCQAADACREHDADIATGPVRRTFEAPVPHWWKSQGVRDMETGTPLTQASTNNILMKARVISSDGLNLRFDDRLTFGNEDLDFFRRAHAAGARIVWAADAWVEERIPASRVRPMRLISRLHMAAAASTYNEVLNEGPLRPALRSLPRALRRIVIGSLSLPAGLLVRAFSSRQGEAIWYKGLARIARATGTLRGLLGYRHRYYDQIDGR